MVIVKNQNAVMRMYENFLKEIYRCIRELSLSVDILVKIKGQF